MAKRKPPYRAQTLLKRQLRPGGWDWRRTPTYRGMRGEGNVLGSKVGKEEADVRR